MKTQHIVDQAKQLIRIPSTSDNPEALQEAIDFIASIIAKCPGVTIERFEKNGKPSFLAYRGKTRPSKFDILLNAHVDVVPAPPEQFVPVIKDGKLFGRGALDMKGTALVLADVFCKFVNVVPYNLALQIVSDEEIGGYDGAKHQIDQGVRADFVVIGEYSNERGVIYNAARGICWAEIVFNGNTAHGGHPWNGTNAVVKAEEFAAAILQRYPTPDKETWTTTASIANLSTPNEVFNKVPDYAVLKIDFRFTQEDPVFESEGSLRAFVASIDPNAELLETKVFEPAINVEELNPYVQGLSAAITRTTGQRAMFKGRPAGSDGRHFAHIQSGVIEYGICGQNSHGDNEYVELSSFDEYHATLCAFLNKPMPSNYKYSKSPSEPLHLQILRKLVSIPTVSSDKSANATAMAYVEHYLRSRGMHIVNFERNGYQSIVATTRPGQKQPKIMFDAHIDVAPAAKDMFQVTIDGDTIHGRGVADVKFGLATYMALVDELKNNLASYDFGIMVTSDGKIGSANGIKMLIEEKGYKPSVAIIPGGGDNWEFETFAKGLQWAKLTARGTSSHASRPWDGKNAIDSLLDTLHEIKSLSPKQPTAKDTFITIGTIDAGTVTNQLADRATATLDIRLGSSNDYERIYQRVQTICAAHSVETEWLINDAPVVNNPDDPHIKPFLKSISHITGKTHKTSYSLGASHGRFYGAAHIPCVIVAPPLGNRHQDSEWLSRKGLDQYYDVVRRYVEQVGKDTSTTQEAIRLSHTSKPDYVWYATYGSGLVHDNFMTCINGGTPEGAAIGYAGCTDKTPPPENHFASIPYGLYFAGSSKAWPNGGFGTLELTPRQDVATVVRVYLITREQFEEIAAQENFHPTAKKLPYAKAIANGHAHISYKQGVYDELLYCGLRGEYPIFTLTSDRRHLPPTPPSAGYTQSVLRGLSENNQSTTNISQNKRGTHRTRVGLP